MADLIRMPRAALQTLLQEAGHSESVEAYLASDAVNRPLVAADRFQQRARKAYWSRFWLLISATFSWASFAIGPNGEDLITGILLGGMTVVEFRVYTFFSQSDPRGARYGWWNQCLFAFLFLLYGIYHGMAPSALPDSAGGGLIDTQAIAAVERLFYYSVGGIGAIGQFWLACYYRSALPPSER